MLIEIGAPACLAHGLVRLDSASGPVHGLLGAALQHPPIHVFAQAGRPFQVTGPRADWAYAQAQRYAQAQSLAPQIEIEIELAIPSQMGLSSDAGLGLSMARALAWAHDRDPADTPALARSLGLPAEDALALWAFDRGGWLVADLRPDARPEPVARRAIEHAPEAAWVWVLVLPRPPQDTPENIEAERLAKLGRAAPHLSADTGRLLESELLPAIEQDQIERFAQGLAAIEALTLEALAQVGAAVPPSTAEQATLEVMRSYGALASGRCLTGLGLYGLVRGAAASQTLRRHLSAHLGPFGGTVLATIVSNTGARHTISDETLGQTWQRRGGG